MIEVRIPKIGMDELQRRHRKMRPVVRRNGKLYYLRPYSLQEIKTTSYYETRMQDIVEQVPDNELEVLEGCDFLCLHPYDYTRRDKEKPFQPMIADILAQISLRDVKWVKAFEIIEAPKGTPGPREHTVRAIADYNGYHVSVVRLYGSAK